MSKRPEHQAPPEIFYNDTEADKYTNNSRVMAVQAEMAERCVELLALPPGPRLLLDVGCGSGLSGAVLADNGHTWLGLDIAPAMLQVARTRLSVTDLHADSDEDDSDEQGGVRPGCGDVLLADMGEGVPFRAGAFDGAISVSALQWLFNAERTAHRPRARLGAFFSALYACLARGARAVLQFYPESDEQVALATAAATRAGFHGGLVLDYPNSTKAKKFYLVLLTGGAAPLPPALGEESGAEEARLQVLYARRTAGRAVREVRGSRSWVQHKKERRRAQGKRTHADSKYTGRRRPAPF